MPLEAGRSLGPYEIVAPIGKGGMGEVYRARDTKLDRDVAIKVLPEELASDGERVARFEREARLLASLNHPNIASIHGFEDSDGIKALVLELVEGETLAERIARGAIPVDEAIAIAVQIAHALDAGHEMGVVHRDLKPANIKLREDDTVKVLDYGLAKALASESESSLSDDLSNSPTLAQHGTQVGMILGTASYMSPEQARGKPVDKRADIWSFGVVLYEMLTGRRAFEGEDASVTLASVIKSEPALESIPADVPRHVRTVLHRCLEKDARQRIRDIGDVRLALEGAFETESASRVDDSASRAPGSWNRLTLTLASLLALATGLAAWALLRTGPEPARRVARFEAPFRSGQAPIGPLAMTRDGAAVVYVGPGEAGGGSQLWIRRWDELDARPIRGTNGARTAGQIALSPDDSEVAFSAGATGPIRVASLDDGATRTLSEWGYNAAWSQDDWVYFSDRDFGVSRVRPKGGELESVTVRPDGELFHTFPHPLPGGKTLLLEVIRSSDRTNAEIWSFDLETSDRKRLTSGSNPRYTTSGHLLFATLQGTLMAAPFDVQRVVFTDDAMPVVQGLATTAATTSTLQNVFYNMAGDGSLMYLAGGVRGRQPFEFVWVTRSGEVTPVDAGESFMLPTQAYIGWRLSPDGRRIALAQNVNGNDDIWTKTLPDGPMSRLTFAEDFEGLPQWTPDGRTITYRNGTLPGGGGDLWSRPANGTGERVLVLDALSAKKGVWSPDGEWLVVRTATVTGEARDIFAVRPGVDAAPLPILASEGFWEQAPAISRDGRWLAYMSNETGRNEVFVRPFPNVDGGKWQVSNGGGIQPVWAHNGKELFFADPKTRELKVTAFTTTSTAFQRAGVETLFVVPPDTVFDPSSTGNVEFYDVALDDEQFLMARPQRADDAGASFVLVQNFFEELKRLVPTN